MCVGWAGPGEVVPVLNRHWAGWAKWGGGDLDLVQRGVEWAFVGAEPGVRG